MAKAKYDKLFFEEPIVEGNFAPKIGLKDLTGLNIRIAYNCISEPLLMVKEPHKHEHEQYMCFIGGNPMDIRDFPAEVEISFGEEGEKHIINKTTVVYIPAGLLHCPLNFKRVDKPIIFMDIYPAAEYQRIPVSR